MKPLYESIKSSIGIGYEHLKKEEIKNWLEGNIINSTNVNSAMGLSLDDIVFDGKDAIIKLNCKKETEDSFIVLQFCKDKEIPSNIKRIEVNGKLANLSVSRIDMKNLSSIPSEYKNLRLLGCNIDKIDSIYNKCESVCFAYAPSLGGGSSCEVGEISGVKIKDFEIINSYGSRIGISCPIKNISGCTFENISLCCGMFYTGQWGTLMSGKTLSDSAKTELNEFLKRNKVTGIIKYLPTSEESKRVEEFEIYYKKNDWHIRPAKKKS